MSIGIVELTGLLMAMSGFGVGTNPTAPTPQAALEYAMPDADVIAYADIGAVVPGNYKVLTNLPNQAQVKSSPELARELKKLIAEVDGPRGLVKGMTGIDLVTDVSDVTATFKIIPKHDPDYVITVHGKFTAATVDKLAKVSGKTSEKLGSATWFDAGDGNAIAVTKNGTMLAGSTSLIKDRLADSWKAPALTAGTNLGSASDALAGKPVFAVVMGLSSTARTEALSMHSDDGKTPPNFFTDMIKRHKQWSFTVNRDGIGWTWVDASKAGMESMAQFSEGVIDLLRASQIAPRGFAKIALGAIDSYKGVDKQIDDLIRHKADLMKIVETYTGDGQFKAQVDKDAKTNKLTVRLTAKSLTEVVPLGGVLPGIGAWLFLAREADLPAPPPPVVRQPSPAAQPQKSSGTPATTPAKKQGNAPKHP